jgi:hypothetical protein
MGRAVGRRSFAVVVAVAAVAAGAAPVRAADDPQAEALFARSRAALAARALPPYAVYDVAVSANLDNGAPLAEHFRSTLDTRLEKVHARTRSIEEAANPSGGAGTNFFVGSGARVGANSLWSYQQINGTNVGRRFTSIGRTSEYLGVPVLSPAYTFGLVRADRTLRPDRLGAEPPAPPAATGDLAAIGRVTTTARTYDVTDAGMETIDGVLTEHLLLQPLRDPRANRLRDLWVDPTDALPVRLRVAANFTQGPSLGAPWLVTFRRTAQGLVIDREEAEAPLRAGRATLEHVTVRFENVAFPRLRGYQTIFFDGTPPKSVLAEP